MSHQSYSQSGEDRIVSFLLASLGHTGPVTYVDAGCAHPIYHNNTFLFYSGGGRGLLIEADASYFDMYKQHRPRDIHENKALLPDGEHEVSTAKFYISSNAGWSTVVASHAELASKKGVGEVREVVEVEASSLTKLIKQYLPHETIHLISIDVEGLDLEILSTFDFAYRRPWIVLAENSGGIATHQHVLEANGYTHWATTNINSVYVDGSILKLARF